VAGRRPFLIVEDPYLAFSLCGIVLHVVCRFPPDYREIVFLKYGNPPPEGITLPADYLLM
jgi:hypothetical protein